MRWVGRSRWGSTAVSVGLAALVAGVSPGARGDEGYGGNTKVAPGRTYGPGPTLLLTFDDGPRDLTTHLVLDELARRDLHAVFFVNGVNFVGASAGAEHRRQLLRDEVDAGNLVGNHTYDHPDLCARSMTASRITAEIDHNADLIEAAVGYRPFLFRAPYGAIRCRKVHDALALRGLVSTGWTIDSEDWKVRNSDRELAIVERQVREIEGSGDTFAIILFHDAQADTAAALPRFLDWIDAENADRAKRGLAPIGFARPDVLVSTEGIPLWPIATDAIGWARGLRWPAPFGTSASSRAAGPALESARKRRER